MPYYEPGMHGLIDPATDLATDFQNEIMKVALARDTSSSDEEMFALMRKSPLQHYDALYESQGYTDIITEKNREAIQQINERIDKLNAITIHPGWRQEIETILNEIRTLTKKGA
jgi:hypothetical protein